MGLPREAGRFQLIRELGRGGMGVVYEAEDSSTQRHVALKVLASDLEYSDEAYQRFEREARLAAAISHPRCVFVFGAHEVDGSPAIAMELMTGKTLDDLIGAGEPLPVTDCVRWCLDVLEGLEAAHRAGVLHRDLKPSNCFLDSNGHVKLGDFGLARTLARDVKLTISGQFLGSPLYASPEQVRGVDMDTRSDVYSVGATLYALLAGRPPFAASGLGQVLAQILTDDPVPLRSLRRQVPMGLASIVDRAMSKDRRDRPARPAALAEELRAWLPTHTAPPLGRRLKACAVDAAWLGAWPLMYGAGMGLALSITAATSGTPSSDGDSASLPPAVAVAAAASAVLMWIGWFAYYPIFETWRAASPGKRSQGLRVVHAVTGLPSRPRALVRAVVSFAVFAGILGLVMTALVDVVPPGIALVVAFAVAFWLPLITARRHNGWRSLPGLLTGTSVVEASLSSPATGGDRDPEPTHLVITPAPATAPTRVGQYTVKGIQGETDTGTLLVADDESLGRAVWIHLSHHEERPPAPSDRNPTWQRWIGAGIHEGRAFTVLEALEGAPLSDYALVGRRLPWPAALGILRELVAVLSEESVTPDVSRVWIDAKGQVRWLHHGFGAAEPARGPVPLVAEAMRLLLRPEGLEPPPDVPLRAEGLLRRLWGGGTPCCSTQELQADVEVLARRPQAITTRMHVVAHALTSLWFLVATPLAFMTGTTQQSGESNAALLVATIVMGLGGLNTFLTLLLRGGLAQRLCGIGVRTLRGPRASRWRCAWRSLLTWMPGSLLLLLAAAVRRGAPSADTAYEVLFTLAVLGLAATLVTSLSARRRSLQDRLAKTVLVPR